jgi:hypothetical protein
MMADVGATMAYAGAHSAGRDERCVVSADACGGEGRVGGEGEGQLQCAVCAQLVCYLTAL